MMNTNTPAKVKAMTIAANLAALNDLLTTAARRSTEARELAETGRMQCRYRRHSRRGLYFWTTPGPYMAPPLRCTAQKDSDSAATLRSGAGRFRARRPVEGNG
jgi:hypothetical protein